jgi:TIR domain/Sel1 repeat
MAHDVFISASSKDKAATDAVCTVLERNRIRVWMAPRDIVPGVGWAASIIEAIKGAKIMVLVFSSHANNSPQIEREVERAVNKGIPVIPFRVENVEPSDALEYFISAPHWLDAYAPPLEPHLERLAAAVRRLLDSEFARATQQEERRKAAEAEVFRLAEEERQRREAAEAARRAEEERRRVEAEATRKAEEERRRAEAEADSRRQKAVPDEAPGLDEAARPAQTFGSETLAKIPESIANRVKDTENGRLRSQPASHWRILSAIGGLTLAGAAVVLLMTKDSGHTPVTDCDRLAADPYDPDRIKGVKGVEFDQINIDLALPACLSATKAYPAELRLAYQFARVLWAAKRFEEARKVLADAANAGSTSAMNTLGGLYVNGEGGAKDYTEAVRLFRQAADLGDTNALCNLGGAYENGNGVTKDIAKAQSYYQMAAERGSSYGKEALKRISGAQN